MLSVNFSGYENFVARTESAPEEDRPSWTGTLDFGGLKLKLRASIVAISGIHLLKAFMNIGSWSRKDLMGLVVTHMPSSPRAYSFPLMDCLTARAKAVSASKPM